MTYSHPVSDWFGCTNEKEGMVLDGPGGRDWNRQAETHLCNTFFTKKPINCLKIRRYVPISL
jgi:hypothetical protein